VSAPSFAEDRWVPEGDLARWRVGAFMARHGFDDFFALHRRSIEDPDWFYRAAFEDLDLSWPVPWTRLYDDADGAPWRRWFVDGRTNLAELAVRRWAQRTPTASAVIHEAEDGRVETITFAELEAAVARAGTGLRRLGLGHGDVVAMYLPMVPEAAILLLAAARIGAIVAPAFSGYGAEALAERLALAEVKILVTADGYTRRGAPVDALGTAREARALAPSVEHLVIVPRLRPDGIVLAPGESLWSALVAEDDGAPIELFAADHPFLVAFTSGSTGRPKGTVHVHGGLPYRWAIDCAYGYDVREGDRFTWLSDMGWIMGPLAICGSLVLGAALVLLETFDHPSPARLWDQVERHGITFLGLSPTIVRLLAGAGDDHVEPFALETLRVIGTTGEPMTPPAWRWLHRAVGRGRVPIVNATGGTEVGAAFLQGSPVVATPECRFAGPALGIDADVLDATLQRPVVGEVGELVVRAPWPSMTRGFYNEGPERYLETYWTRLPGTWVHGDRAIRHADGSWELPGRSDDLIKVAGKRVGPVEFESIATAVDGVDAAIAVGVPHPLKGEVVVVLVEGPDAADRAVADAVTARVGRRLGKPMRPHAVLGVAELPVLRNGKLHRRAARAWLTGEDPGDLSSLANPAAEAAVLIARERLSREGRS
jgi:acetyl-CoA synthetase